MSIARLTSLVFSAEPRHRKILDQAEWSKTFHCGYSSEVQCELFYEMFSFNPGENSFVVKKLAFFLATKVKQLFCREREKIARSRVFCKKVEFTVLHTDESYKICFGITVFRR